MAKKYFGTDGIRGAVNSKYINGDMFFKFGLASGTYFKSQKKKTNSNNSKRYKIVWIYTLEPALVSGLASARYACLHFRPFTNQWIGYVNKRNEGQYGYYDYSIS